MGIGEDRAGLTLKVLLRNGIKRHHFFILKLNLKPRF